jgi:hypothetical protein
MTEHISEILIVTGLLTMGTFAAFLTPATILNGVFGVVATEAGTRYIVQHWGLLVFLMGALLVFAGRHPEMQVPMMAMVATEKLVGSGMALMGPLRRRTAAPQIITADSVIWVCSIC